ncbi:MAG: hypothetical protein KDB07_05915, partial [Planctomycetes bacterium]|nr:hypothetical protein [Planctomycetota bacterium]
QQQFNFAVADAMGVVPNIGPAFNTVPSGAQTVHVSNTLYEFQFAASDPDGDPISYTFSSITERSNNPVTGTTPFIDATGKFSWDQMPDGIYDIQIRASDGTNVTPFFWCVTTYTPPAQAPLPCNQPPTISLGTIPIATQGQQFSHRVTASDPENDNIVWQLIFPASGNVANGMTIQAVAGNSRLADITWTPTFNQTPGAYPVTVQAEDISGNIATSNMLVQLQVGPPQPTDVRVFVSGFTTPTGAGNAKSSDIRGIEEMDPALSSNHSFALTGASMLDFRDFGRGASSLALTGPKHNLRIGSQIPREVLLGTTSTYIQLPVYTTLDPANPPFTKQVSGRLYHGTNEETQNLTGSSDFIAVFNTAGYAMVFEFGTNIMEEIYVPTHFSELPYFVVTSDARDRMWICRLDGGVFAGSNNRIMEFDLTSLNGETVYHQTVIGTLDRLAAAGTLNFGHLNLWFAAEGAGADRLFRVAGDGAAGNPPSAAVVNLDLASSTAPTRISTYTVGSGDSRRAAIVAGDDMTTFINTADAAQNLGKFRDIWMLDGETLNNTRVTDFAANRPSSGPDVRLIDTFDGSSNYSENFENAMAGSDLGGNDRRTLFAENATNGNSSTVGLTMNYNGSLVAFVVLETNSGNSDGASTFVRDEVYVAGVNSTSLHDVIRLTAEPGANDSAGTRCEAASRFQTNCGVCMGLAFPMFAPDAMDARNFRLFFAYGMNVSGSLIEQSTVIYSAEFGVNGTNDITHSSTIDRTTGSPSGPNGYEVPDDDTQYRVFGGSAEGFDATTGASMFTFLYFEGGSATLNATGRLFWLDANLPNSGVNAANPTTILAPFEDADQNTISVYRINASRTLYSSGRDQTAPWGGGAGSSTRFPIHANLFRDVPGPATTAIQTTRAFVAVETSANNETLYEFNMALPSTPITDIGNIPGMGRIHNIEVSNDGTSVAALRSQSLTAFQSERYSTTVINAEWYLIPSVSWALSQNSMPAMKMYSATAAQTGILGAFVARSAVWVDTSDTTLADTREFWFAGGTSTPNSTTTYTTELQGQRTPITRMTNMAPMVGASTAIDAMIVPADRGSVVFYGSGTR